jgi:hypothetical protein
MDTDTEHTGAMIALVPTDADLDRLALNGGEPRDELHLTLYYLGDAADVAPDVRAAIITSIRDVVDRRDLPEVRGNAFGVAHWNPTSDDPAWVLNVGDVPTDDRDGLAVVRETISEALADGGVPFTIPPQHTPWQPHVCLAYSSDDLMSAGHARLGGITFDRVRVAFGGEVTDVLLGRGATVASTSGGTIVPWHIVQDHAECPEGEPWAVVKDADGSVAGCHASQSAANDQLAALYASETEATVAPIVVGETGLELVTATTPILVAAAKGGDDCPEGHRRLPNGECVSPEEYAARSAWYGVLVVEGTPTGDGREFAPEALSWVDNGLLRWQKEGSHGGDHDVTVSVGRIDEVWRVGNQVVGRGVMDIESVDGFELARRMKDGFAGGISIDADDIQDADVEFVWSEDPDGHDEDDPLLMLFGRPEKVIYHGGRVRAATVCDIPAFVEARIQLGTVDTSDVALVAGGTSRTISAAVVPTHATATTDAPWNADAARLPNIVNLDVARAAYAWVADPVGDRVGRPNCAYLHHEVVEGKVGAANLTACAAAIAALRVAEHTDEDRSTIYAHLAGHLRDAGQEPPPLDEPDAVTAALALDAWRPPSDWFVDPQFSVHTGITVTDEGRVYGHAAPWGECHVGYQNECITLPREDAHPYFMTGEVVCADGARVAVGQITVGTGHAPLGYRASQAAEHYDNTGAAVADVAVGNDRFGLWIAGAIRPSVAASRVHELRASGRLSGDWRRIGGQLRLVGLLAVNVPGFPLPAPRARIASGAPLALVAAGAGAALGPGNRVVEPTDAELDQLAMRRVMRVLATRVRSASQETQEV